MLAVIVCHCEVVSDRTVRTAILSGARSTADVADRCGAGGRCGGCHRNLQRLLDEAITPVRLAGVA